MTEDKYQRFANLTFEDFRKAATDDSLSRYEKIGFPDSYREGKEELIFQSIRAHLPLLDGREKLVLDIGPGCSDLPRMMIDHCRDRGHRLLLVDSEEMLATLPDGDCVRKIAACFPQCESLFDEYREKVDVIVTYSVLHYAFADGNVWDFLDRALELLAEGAEMLIGDIPNISKRRRFFSSAHGVQFHQQFTGTQTLPDVQFNRIQRKQIDDAVVMGLVARARAEGFDAYVLPQASGLPMANRREDILIRRP